MKTLTKTLVAGTSTLLLTTALNANAAMDPYIETALIDVCKAAMNNKVIQFKNTTKSYRLKDKTVALKVMCNGDDIIAFAERHGADKTAAHLEHQLGRVSIQDVALNRSNKINVTFAE